ncbi:751_t:CDS:2, partial [Ambispora leptoticha]
MWSTQNTNRENLLFNGASNSTGNKGETRFKNDKSSSLLTQREIEASTARTYEQQNDSSLEELSSKLSVLHKINVEIYDEVNNQVNLIDETGISYTSLKGTLTSTVGRMRNMTSIRHKRYL